MTTEQRIAIRRLANQGVSQREIAERTGHSKSVVNRVLSEAPAQEPVGHTPDGAPLYKAGRFDDDPDYQERVAELARDMPLVNARKLAARELAGPAAHTHFAGQVEQIRTPAEKAEILAQLDLDDEAA